MQRHQTTPLYLPIRLIPLPGIVRAGVLVGDGVRLLGVSGIVARVGHQAVDLGVVGVDVGALAAAEAALAERQRPGSIPKDMPRL